MDPPLIHVVAHSYFEVDALCEGNRVNGEGWRVSCCCTVKRYTFHTSWHV